MTVPHHLLELPGLSEAWVERVFLRASHLHPGQRPLEGRSVLALFPDTSIRTRITFERGVSQLGGHVVRFPPETLERKEDLRDLTAYLANWIDLAIIRHPDFTLLQRFAEHASFPVINAMTSRNHPCEILSDLYGYSRLRPDWRTARYLFVGAKGNICDTWMEAANLLGLDMTQTCLPEFRSPVTGPTIRFDPEIERAIRDADIVLADGLLPEMENETYLATYRITPGLMATAKPGALCNPCPPFTRGGEISEDLVESPYFIGHRFKADLLKVQQAIMLECLEAQTSKA
jgi:ornithine carbamoyltransferase